MEENEINDIDDYGFILKKFGIAYEMESPWIKVGDVSEDKKWIFYLSVLTNDVKRVLEKIAPILFAERIGFKVLQNSIFVNRTNGLYYGIHMAGKIIVIVPPPGININGLILEINELTKNYMGPLAKYAIQVGPIMYSNYCLQEVAKSPDGDKLYNRYFLPEKRPFKVPKAFRVKKRKPVLGKYYIPIKTLNESPKGGLFLGINIKRFAFSHCVIKVATKGSYTDTNGRTGIHSLIWQKHVMENLQDSIPIPKVLDFFKKKGDHYLIMEYVEGQTLNDELKRIFLNRKWSELLQEEKRHCLNLYKKVLIIINRMHELGYLHRDITSKNFIIEKSGDIKVIDFELTYSLKNRLPDPVYTLGTYGFSSPEQFRSDEPAIAQDIYSLGALFIVHLTGAHISLLAKGISQELRELMIESGHSNALIEFAFRCLSENISDRPVIDEIEYMIQMEFADLFLFPGNEKHKLFEEFVPEKLEYEL